MLGLLVYIPFFIFNTLTGAYENPNLQHDINRANFNKSVDAVSTVFSLATQTRLVADGLLFTATPSVYITAPVPPGGWPSAVPTDTSEIDGSNLLVFKLSFYDPHIGYYDPSIAHVNCLQWDEVKRDCLSRVNYGRDQYKIWYGRGAACSNLLARSTRFLVLEPPELRGEWQCIDTGNLDIGNGDTALHIIDFLLHYPTDIWTGPNLNDFPWRHDVVIKIIQ